MLVIDYSNNFHERTKHIEIKYNYIRNMKEEVLLNYFHTGLMVVDSLIKSLTLDLFRTHERDGDVKLLFNIYSFSILSK